MPEANGAGGPVAAGEWRSLGGTAAIHVAAGDLFPLVLIISSDRAVMHARMTRPGQDPGAPGPFSVLPPGQWREPQFADVTVVDDQQAKYTIAAESAYVQSARGARGRSARLRLRLSPRLDPAARSLTLTFLGSTDEVTVDFDLR